MQRPIKRLDAVTENTANILAGVKKTLDSQKQASVKEIVSEDSNRILFKKATSTGSYTDIGMGLYKEADTTKDLGKIWIKKTFKDPVTGSSEDWLVVYTNDEGEIIRQVANEYRNDLAKIAVQPNPKNIPIAPGIKSKNITIDETGGQGTAKVTVEFTDVDKGYDFFKQQGESGEGKEETSDKDESSDKDEASDKGDEVPEIPQEQSAQKGVQPTPMQGAQPQPQPQIQPAQSSLRSTVNIITHNGQKSVDVLRKEGKYLFINESGSEIDLPWKQDLRLGTQFERPDTGEIVRLNSYKDVRLGSVDTIALELFSSLTSEAVIEHEDGEYVVKTKNKSKTLGKHKNKKDAIKQLQSIEINKHKHSSMGDEFVDDYGSESEFEIGDEVSYDDNKGNRGQGIIVNCLDDSNEYIVEDDSNGKSLTLRGDQLDLKEDFENSDFDSGSDEGIFSSQKKIAADISDEIPPMGWKTDDGNSGKPSGAGPDLPQQPELQQDQKNDDVVYDSNQDPGPQFQTTVNPKDKSVKIKFLDNPEEDALNQAVNKQQPQVHPTQTAQPAVASPQSNQQQQKPQFNQQEIPTNF